MRFLFSILTMAAASAIAIGVYEHPIAVELPPLRTVAPAEILIQDAPMPDEYTGWIPPKAVEPTAPTLITKTSLARPAGVPKGYCVQCDGNSCRLVPDTAVQSAPASSSCASGSCSLPTGMLSSRSCVNGSCSSGRSGRRDGPLRRLLRR
jgi:hypothetical protein